MFTKKGEEKSPHQIHFASLYNVALLSEIFGVFFFYLIVFFLLNSNLSNPIFILSKETKMFH